MSSASDDLAPIFSAALSPTQTLLYSQGVIRAWNPSTLSNQIERESGLGTVLLEDIPVLSGVSALGYEPGQTVALLGFDQDGSKGFIHWWVLGRLAIPGQDSPDVIIRGSNLIVEGTGAFLVRDSFGNVRVAIWRSSGGGQVATYHDNGTPHVIIGEITSEEIGESVGQGVIVQAPNGNDLFNIFNNPITGVPQVRAFDDTQHVVFRTDQNGTGLERPYTDIPMYCPRSVGLAGGGTDTPWVLDVTGNPFPNAGNPEGAELDDWVTIWSGRMYASHPGISAQIRAVELSGQGQARLLVNGIQVGVNALLQGTTTFHDFATPANLPGSLVIDGDNFYQVEIQARATAVPARMMVVPYGVTKRGSV